MVTLQNEGDVEEARGKIGEGGSVECYYNSHFEGYSVAKYQKVARMA